MMKKMISLLQRLHQSNTVMKNHFELFQSMIHHENLVQEVNPLCLKLKYGYQRRYLELHKDSMKHYLSKKFHAISIPFRKILSMIRKMKHYI